MENPLVQAQKCLWIGEIDAAARLVLEAGSTIEDQREMFRAFALECMEAPGIRKFTYGRKTLNIIGDASLMRQWSEKLRDEGFETEATIILNDADTARPDDIGERLDVPNEYTIASQDWNDGHVGFKRVIEPDAVRQLAVEPKNADDIRTLRGILRSGLLEPRTLVEQSGDITILLERYLVDLGVFPRDIFDALGITDVLNRMPPPERAAFLARSGITDSSQNGAIRSFLGGLQREDLAA